jgi:hypothetical protein
MAIFGTNSQSLAGVISISIDTLGENTFIDLMSIGDITYEFDLIPTQEQSTYIGGIPGSTTVTAFDRLSNQGSFFDAMENALGTYVVDSPSQVSTANVNITVQSRITGQTHRFPFWLKFQDIALDDRSNTVSIKLSPRSTNISLGEWTLNRAPLLNVVPFTPVPYFFLAGSRFETPDNVVPVGEMLYDMVMTLVDDPANTNIYESAQNIVQIPSVTGVKYGTVTNVVCDAFPLSNRIFQLTNGSVFSTFAFNGTTTTSYNTNAQMMDFVRKFAGMEGAIFGSGFGVNFYVNRKTNTHNVELGRDDVVDLGFTTTPRAYNAVSFTTETQNIVPDGLTFMNANVVFTGWPDAKQSTALDFRGYDPYLIQGCLEFDSIVPYGFPIISNSAPLSSNLDVLNIYQDALFATAFSGYASAFGMSSTRTAPYRIEVDVLGFESVRPYEVIKFNNTVPLRYQGKHFRPTSLAYDLVGDRVKVTAYQIDSFPVVEPVTNINVNVGTCESGGYMINLLAYTPSTNVNSDENGTYTQLNLTAYDDSTNVNSDENGTYTQMNLTTFNNAGFFASETNSGESTTNFNAFLTA